MLINKITFTAIAFSHLRYKNIMSHMTPEYQRLYKDVAYALAKHEMDESKKPMVKEDEQTQKES